MINWNIFGHDTAYLSCIYIINLDDWGNVTSLTQNWPAIKMKCTSDHMPKHPSGFFGFTKLLFVWRSLATFIYFHDHLTLKQLPEIDSRIFGCHFLECHLYGIQVAVE